MRYADTDLQRLRDVIVEDRNVPKALKLIHQYMIERHCVKFEAQWEEINGNYLLMKDYMHRGLKDPQFEDVYSSLLCDLYRLNSDLQLSVLVSTSSVYAKANGVAQSISLDDSTIKEKLEEFVQDVTMLSLEANEVRKSKEQDIYSKHQQYMDKLFNAIFVSPQWSESTAQFLTQLILSPTIDSIDAQVLVSAITLSNIQLFDIRKHSALLNIFLKSNDEAVKQRALVGFALGMPQKEQSIFPFLKLYCKEVGNNTDILKDLVELQIQFFYCMNADADNEKLQKDIIPQIMKGNNLSMMEGEMIEKEEDVLSDILHPDAADHAMEELENSFQQMMNMQKAGADIYFGGFSQMKRFSFFTILSNWFMPFYEKHPALQYVYEQMGNSKILQNLLDNGPFCNSDKYSFALATARIINQIPANMREVLENQGALHSSVIMEDKASSAYLRRMYLQDLYRFYRLFSQKEEFCNPFNTYVNENTIFFVVNSLLFDTAIKNRAVEIGRFLYKHHFYRELRLLLTHYSNKDSLEYWELLALCYYQNKDYQEAAVAYDKMLLIDKNNEKAIKGKAYTSFYLGNYQQAIKCCRKLLQQDENNHKIQLNLAVSLINNGNLDEGMNILFKLNYEYPNHLPTQRSLAWGYLRQNKVEHALSIYQRLTDNSAHEASDYLNAGYCMWFQSDIVKAIGFFQQYINMVSKHSHTNAQVSLHHIFDMDVKLLRQYHISAEESCVMEDLVNGE